MDDIQNTTPMARPLSPIAIEPQAPAATDYPTARAIAHAGIPPAEPPPAILYPIVRMLKSEALIDLAIVALVIVFYVALEKMGLTATLMERFPRLGIFSGNLCIGLMSFATIGLILRVRRQGVTAIGIHRLPARTFLVGIIAGVPGAYGAGIVAAVTYTILSGIGSEGMLAEKTELIESMPVLSLKVVIPFAIFVGIHEELLFRGLILPRLRVLAGGDWVAIALNAILFGLLHIYQGWVGVFQTGAIGLVLAIIAVQCRSVWPAIFVHGIVDIIGLSLIQLIRDHPEWLETLTKAPASAA